MLRPSMQTLKHIVVNIYPRLQNFREDDHLYGIPSDLEDIRAKDNIETVTIGLGLEYLDRSWMLTCRRADDGGCSSNKT